MLGNFTAAECQLDEASQLANEGGDPLLIAKVHLASGVMHQASNNRDTALKSFLAALAEAEAAQVLLDQAHALRATGEVLASDDPEGADNLCELG
jgi:cobalamin biosynthesis protein CbiD